MLNYRIFYSISIKCCNCNLLQIFFIDANCWSNLSTSLISSIFSSYPCFWLWQKISKDFTQLLIECIFTFKKLISCLLKRLKANKMMDERNKNFWWKSTWFKMITHSLDHFHLIIQSVTDILFGNFFLLRRR